MICSTSLPGHQASMVVDLLGPLLARWRRQAWCFWQLRHLFSGDSVLARLVAFCAAELREADKRKTKLLGVSN